MDGPFFSHRETNWQTADLHDYRRSKCSPQGCGPRTTERGGSKRSSRLFDSLTPALSLEGEGAEIGRMVDRTGFFRRNPGAASFSRWSIHLVGLPSQRAAARTRTCYAAPILRSLAHLEGWQSLAVWGSSLKISAVGRSAH